MHPVCIFFLFYTAYAAEQCCTVSFGGQTFSCDQLQSKFPGLKLDDKFIKTMECSQSSRSNMVMNTKLSQIKLSEGLSKKFEGLSKALTAGLSARLNVGLTKGYLNLSSRNDHQAQSDLFKANLKTKVLDLHNNLISIISPKSFVNLDVKVLNLEKNNLSSLKEKQFIGLHTERLNLRYNGILNIAAFVFQGIENCENLLLSHNQIKNIDELAFSGIKNITNLDLSYNKLSCIPCGTFKELSTLNSLELSNNMLKTLIMGTFTGVTSLLNLNLGNNNLVNFDSSILLSLFQLNSLDLSQNNLISFDGEALCENVPSIKKITLDDNFWRCSVLAKVMRQFKKKRVVCKAKKTKRCRAMNINGVACTLEDKKFNLLEDFLLSVQTSTNINAGTCG